MFTPKVRKNVNKRKKRRPRMLYRENELAKSMRMRSKYLLRKWYRVKRSSFGLFLLCLWSLNNCSIYYDSMKQSAKGTTLRKREATRPIKTRCGRKADRCKAAPDRGNKEIHVRVFFFTETEEVCFSVFRTGSAMVSYGKMSLVCIQSKGGISYARRMQCACPR